MKSRNYSESEKSAVVERFLVGGESVSTIAADTGISRSTLYAWIKSAQIEPVTLDFTLKKYGLVMLHIFFVRISSTTSVPLSICMPGEL